MLREEVRMGSKIGSGAFRILYSMLFICLLLSFLFFFFPYFLSSIYLPTFYLVLGRKILPLPFKSSSGWPKN